MIIKTKIIFLDIYRTEDGTIVEGEKFGTPLHKYSTFHLPFLAWYMYFNKKKGGEVGLVL